MVRLARGGLATAQVRAWRLFCPSRRAYCLLLAHRIWGAGIGAATWECRPYCSRGCGPFSRTAPCGLESSATLTWPARLCRCVRQHDLRADRASAACGALVVPRGLGVRVGLSDICLVAWYGCVRAAAGGLFPRGR